MQINDLTRITAIADADDFPVWDNANQDTRKVSVKALADFFGVDAAAAAAISAAEAATSAAGSASMDAAAAAASAVIAQTYSGILFPTRSVIAALDTTIFITAMLGEFGREGMFRKVATAAVAGLIAVDTQQGYVFPSTHNPVWSWVRADVTAHNLRHFGAVGDGVVAIDDTTDIFTPTGTGAVTGTDNLAALKCAAAVQVITGFPILLPAGVFVCNIPNGAAQIIVPVGSKFHMYAETPGASWLVMNDDRTYLGVAGNGQTGNVFLAPSQYFDVANYNRGQNEYFTLVNVGIRGTWWRDIEKGGKAWTGAQPYRIHALGPVNTAKVWVSGCSLRDVMGFGSIGRSNQSITYLNNDVRRVCGDGLRGEDCSNFTAQGNFILHCDDDSISNPDLDDIANSLRPRRSIAKLIGNTILCSEGPLVLGPDGLIVTDNFMDMCYGTSLTAFAQNSDAPDRGEGGLNSVTIANNIVRDHMQASDRATPPAGGWTGTDVTSYVVVGAIATAITTATPIGEGTGTPVTEPWYNTDFKWGALHLQDMAGTSPDAASGARSLGIMINGNQALRTRPIATLYSDYGRGKRFTRWGFDDPVVAASRFAKHGWKFDGAFDGIEFHPGVIEGFTAGAGIYLAGATVDNAYKRFKILGGSISRVRFGVDCDAGAVHYQDIIIDGVLMDGDPDRVQAERVATAGNHNKWSSTAVAAPAAVHLSQIKGAQVTNCQLRNFANPYVLEVNTFDNFEYSRVQGNIAMVDFGIAGASTTHADNRGMGRIPAWGDEISYDIRDLDPASGTFMQSRQTIARRGSGVPTVGYHVLGQQKVNTFLVGGTINELMYVAQTTSNAHAGSDWAIITATTT